MKKPEKESRGIFIAYLVMAILVLAEIPLFIVCLKLTLRYSEISAEEASAQAIESLGIIDREYSIGYLSQTKGKIETIKHLSYRVNADEEALFTELTNIIESANKFYLGEDSPTILLRDFTLVAPDDTSDIRNYCEILIEQIENQISDIRFGKADA